ncbi:hypothetical protein CK203_056464 [Vitis vinifera]|uniref:Uncharacterized protein n=1 Tax=Vitis vinifera TaxID=29760 RepID=A0A438GTM7_VITVI|nr:hypothetical protein CK203_056464 [Vitis vinifera]
MKSKEGGNCWFAVESKSFKISIDNVGESYVASYWRVVEASPRGLANKLRSLGVVTPFEDKVGSGTIGKGWRLGDVVWLQLGDRDLRSREEQLGCCLVGQWGEKTTSFPDLALLRRWRLKEE